MIVVPVGEQFFLVDKNTSKEQIRAMIIEKRQFVAKIVGGAIVMIGLSLWVLTQNQMRDLFLSMNSEFPLSVRLAPYASVILGFFTYFFLSSMLSKDPQYSSVDTNEGKVRVTVMQNGQSGLAAFLIIGIAVAIIMMMFVLPIYNLTGAL